MAGLSYPFDAGPGSTITEDQWSYLIKDAIGTGVHEDAVAPYSGQLEVYSIAETGIVRVRAGRATIQGFHYQQSGEEILAVTANASPTLDRMDAVVLHLDLETDAITLMIKLGVASSTPAAPSIASNELLLATIIVQNNTSTVLGADVTDLRAFVGRRMLVSKGDPNVGIQGDIIYEPTADTWYGMPEDGFRKAFSFEEDLDAHIAAGDPHPQYMTLAESTPTVVTSNLTASGTMTTNAAYCRGLQFPGGFTIVHLYYYGTFNGADQSSSFTMFTIDNADMRPNFTYRTVGHQWKFQNSIDDIPLVSRVNPSGSVTAGAETWLMGGAFVLVNAVYFKGTGL